MKRAEFLAVHETCEVLLVTYFGLVKHNFLGFSALSRERSNFFIRTVPWHRGRKEEDRKKNLISMTIAVTKPVPNT